jgi:superoxide reductase
VAQRMEIYKCEVCGNIVEVVHGGKGQLVCCGQPMVLLDAKTADEGREKHLPVIEKTGDGYTVRVGSVPHPMEDKHQIEWIELVADGTAYRQFLEPGGAPEAHFCVEAASVSVREHCNIHGLWQARN